MSRPNQFLSPEGDLEDYFVNEYWLIDQWVGDTLWTWGQNTSGQLGINNTTSPICTPVQTFIQSSNWKQVSCGQLHTVAIKTDGTLWTWGSNASRLGDNTTTTRSTPVTTFAGGTNWKQVACGSDHTAAIKTDGTLWVWGSNTSGQVGDNTTTTRSTPVTTFAGGTNWKQVSAGDLHTVAIKTDGTLWAWGRGANGQLGDNTITQKNTPVTTFAGGDNWKQVGCGRRHTTAIKNDGTLWTWGQNDSGNLGDNTITQKNTPVTTFLGGNNWKQVGCGYLFTAAIKTDGTLWTFGTNSNGQLGVNDVTDRLTPVTTFSGGTNWKQVSGKINHISAIKTDGTLWTWGFNGDVKLGTNNITSRSTPVTTFLGGTNWKQVDCGWNHTAAVTSGTDPTYFIS